ncbi:AN1-type zinc finger protein 6-like [Cotesia glomerata]|uniref:AN1-type zinc finger protein 6-like n=1 Tax=Cotesia glomerata TaxID=32391 RepID=UPI001D017476|nr:AN1-type zinc finger protein 6-like [Cotesia glomerata]
MESVKELCLGGCGFFGSPANEGRCSVCYKEYIVKKQLSSLPKPAATSSNPESSSSSSLSLSQLAASCSEDLSDIAGPETATSEPEKLKKRNRCFTCRKKIGLTGFDCRCGGVFCGLHRYSDMHACNFDYKKMAAEEIRRKNPVINGTKIEKI